MRFSGSSAMIRSCLSVGHVASRNGRAKSLDRRVLGFQLVSLFAEAVGRRDAIPGSQFVCKRLDRVLALPLYCEEAIPMIPSRLPGMAKAPSRLRGRRQFYRS